MQIRELIDAIVGAVEPEPNFSEMGRVMNEFLTDTRITSHEATLLVEFMEGVCMGLRVKGLFEVADLEKKWESN